MLALAIEEGSHDVKKWVALKKQQTLGEWIAHSSIYEEPCPADTLILPQWDLFQTCELKNDKTVNIGAGGMVPQFATLTEDLS